MRHLVRVVGLCVLVAGFSGCKKKSRRAAPAPALSSPTVTSVTPASGDIAGGTAIAIAGTDLQAGATVTVGGTPATSVVVSPPTSITANVPGAAAAGAADVVVTNPDGQMATLSNGFTYTNAGAGPAPTITGVSPTSGPDAGGTLILNGHLLTDATLAHEQLEERFQGSGLTPLLQNDEDGRPRILVLPISLDEAASSPAKPWINGLLFAATLLTTTWGGDNLSAYHRAPEHAALKGH